MVGKRVRKLQQAIKIKRVNPAFFVFISSFTAMTVQGNIVDIFNKRIFKGELTVENRKIVSILQKAHKAHHHLLPGFIDAHIHIESAMLVPSQFANAAVKHGTVATVSDPHEIANVLGVKGVYFMIDNGKQ